MPFDPAIPAHNDDIESAELRAQFNGLKDLIDAIPAGPPGPQGPAGADGATGPQGDPGPMPPLNPFIAPGRIIAHNGDLTLATDDPNGSSETSLIHSAEPVPGGLIPAITGKTGGGTSYTIRTDPAGIVDGAGAPSVQHDDRLIHDGASGLWKPARRLGLLFADLAPLATPVSDPPTQAEVQANRDRLNELLTRLQGM